MTRPCAIGTRNRSCWSFVPARCSGPQPRLVCAATISPSDPQTRPISSIAMAYARVSRPAPPSSSGIGMPSQPSSPMRRTISTGKRRSRSCSSTTGATSVSMNSRMVSRRSACSGERSRSIAASVPAGPTSPSDSAAPAPVLGFADARDLPVGPGIGRSPDVRRRRARTSRVRRRPVQPATRPAPAPAHGWALVARPAGRPAGRLADRRPPAAPGARGGEPGEPSDGPSRRRPAAAPLRRHCRRPGPVPIDL